MNAAESSFVEKAPRLPIRIAAQVAWSSIKVRLSRSLVTVSSVVLAVAFLLVVIGGDITDRAVYTSFASDDQPNADVRAIYEVLAKPRGELALLKLLADDPGITEWAASYGTTVPNFDPADAASALELVRWVDQLKATDRFKALDNLSLAKWILNLDTPGAADAFLEKAGLFRGVRLPMDPQRVLDIAAASGSLRDAVAAMQAVERSRIRKISQSGGVDTVLAGIRDGSIPNTEAQAVGLPLAQILGSVEPQRWSAIRNRLDILDLRARAIAILDGVNRLMPGVIQLRLDDVVSGELATRVSAYQADLGSRLGNIDDLVLDAKNLDAVKEKIAAFSEISALSGDAEREEAIARELYSPGLQAHIANLRLSASLSGQEQERLASELSERKRLEEISQTLNDGGFDPEDDGERTFWLLVLSLLVCIVGIVNSMMMAVTERFREIATMKCLGAMDGFILKAFLIESGSVGVVGALLGAILGILIVLLQGSVAYGGTFWGAFPAGLLSLASLASLGCGILLTIFGALLPAYKAARMHPIEAMRLET